MRKLTLLATAAALTTTLTACPGVERPSDTAPQPEQLRHISATARQVVSDGSELSPSYRAAAWNQGQQTLQAVILDPAGNEKVIATGQIAADGKLGAELPATVPDADLSPLGNLEATWAAPKDDLPLDLTCSGPLTVSDPAGRTAGVMFRYGGAQDILPGELPTAQFQLDEAKQTLTFSSHLVQGSYVYADRPVTMTGQQQCTASENGSHLAVHTTLNVKLKQGWNYVQIEQTRKGQLAGETYHFTQSAAVTSQAPAGVWYTAPAGMALPLSLKNALR